MSEKRTTCSHCGVSILEVTAKYNDGMCAPCRRNRDCEIREREEAKARRNAPPPPINYASFTEREFIEGLTKVCQPHRDDPEQIAEEFLGFCDPILQSASSLALVGAFFPQSTLYSNLKRIPRPFRETIAAYQAWGLVTSDGFGSYLDYANKKFDAEVDRGLTLLGRGTAVGLVAEARRAPKDSDGDIPKPVEDNLEKRFDDSLKNFDAGILGPYLIRLLFES